MSDKSQTYTVLSPLNHDGKDFQRGEYVELTEEQAEPLTYGRTPTVKKGKFQLADVEIEDRPKNDPKPSRVTDTVGKTDKDTTEVDTHGDIVDDADKPGIAPGESDKL